MLEALIIILTVTMLGITLAPLLPSNHWLCRVWEFPRVQIAFLTICVLASSLYITSPLLQIVLVMTNALVAIYQLAWIFPYTSLYPKQVPKAQATDSTQSIKILTSNVLMTNHSSEKLVDLISLHQPDVVITLETDDWWQNALVAIHSDYPYRVNRPLDNLYGMHLYSKFVLEDVKVMDLIEEGVPSMHCYLKMKDERRVKCHFLHPAPPSPTENDSAKPRDKELLLIAKEVANNTEPTIVTGDLNDVAWSPTTRAFRRISGLQDPRIGRGMFNTFHANYPVMRWPLDHIFHSQHFALASIQRLPSIDSDHFPLLSELVYLEN
ncbi:endonuclease/exonuclease/phosphatase family protein [uncultured Paraglaciecola sp.]|uniref:endonuclease/exonuclease/phosphatase family protein n=1 Tax=uncultured Paraglaciecola sp. TaxID=1765024 RepID=UPI0030D9F745|tara:strand:+ start:39126 stop:40094 length:969 start_codon:yes stop_codon:yes gene_type:complete